MESRLNEDFPIDWEEDGYVSRREFFKFVTLASGGLAVGSVGLAVWSKTMRQERAFEPMRIASLTDVAPGSAIGFEYPRPKDICLLIRRTDGTYTAYSRRCTHLSCPVNYQPENNRIFCPCHSGAFSLDDGRVLQGPPSHALPRIQIEIREDSIWATGVLRGEA